MELHFIILSALCAILLLFIILAIIAYCCGDLCCGCGNSSYSHSRESYHNETVINGTKRTSKGEYRNEHYSNSGQILPSLLPSKQSEFEVDENQSTPLITKYPPQPLGFGYPVETPSDELREMPQPALNSSSPTNNVPAPSPYPENPEKLAKSRHIETVAYTDYTPTAPTRSTRTPYQEHPENIEVSQHVKTVSYAPYQHNKQSTVTSIQTNGTPPIANQNIPYSSDQTNQRIVVEREPFQRDPRNIETVHHVKSVSHTPPSSNQFYASDIEKNRVPQPAYANSHQPTKNASHSETQFTRTVMTLPSKQRMAYQEDPGTQRSYHVEVRSPSQHYSEENDSYGLNSHQPTETMYFTRPGSCPPSNETEYDARRTYSLDPRRNKTLSSSTVTYSNENFTPYPVSMRVANSVELLPSADSEVALIGKGPFKKQSSQVSLYDNM